MNEPKAQGQEPTMEEILASIRRIISENDEPEAAPKAAQPAAKPAVGNDGILDLTEMVGADGKVVSLAAAKPAPVPEPPRQESPLMVDPNLEPPPKPQTDMAADDVVLSSSDPVPVRQEPEPEPAAGNGADRDDALVGAATAAASTAAFAALAKRLDRGGAQTSGAIPIGSGRTLEDLVQEMIRPMLREWLDDNLPGMVERMIKREIERIVRRSEE